jgi:phosphatidylglycerol---prolipoprotein diacylglyceryl transferase
VHPVLFRIGSLLVPSYGALAALGVLFSLFLALHTARTARVDPGQVWNLCVLSLFAAVVGERLLLIVMNWGVLQRHPSWVMALAMIHHPLLAGAGVAAGGGCAFWYARRRKLPLRSTADALAAPLALGLAFEQLGALLAGSGYGIEAGPAAHWAVTCRSPLAALWSGAPLGVPLHPVQADAALAFLALALLLLFWPPRLRRPGDLAGIALMGMGAIIFITETWRDPEGRGLVLHGTIDGPQIAALVLVLIATLVLVERKGSSMANNEAVHAEVRGRP